MKKWMKMLLGISLSFMCFFSSLGFATLSDTLSVTGDAKTAIPYGLFITEITDITKKNVDHYNVEFTPYTTTVDTLIDRVSNSAGTVSFKITVKNNTRLTYSYRDIYYQTNLDGYNGNNYVSETSNSRRIYVKCSLDEPGAEKKVAPGGTLTFDVSYTVGSQMDARTDWSTLINYRFGINVDGEEEALAVVEAKFLNILNTPSTYNQLIQDLDNKFDGRQEWTSNYIGNVTGSSSEDSVAVNTLFAGQLQITVGDDEMDATVLIKHENLDGNRLTGDDYTAINETNGGVFRGYGCEMTLYLTIDPLNRAGTYVPVYAVVFTCDRDADGNKISDWYRIGSTYAGKANVVTYNGANGTGSFVTDNWKADAATYRLIDGYSFNINGVAYNLNAYSHNIAKDTSIKTIVTTKDAAAVRTFQSLLNDARRIVDDTNYAGVGIELIEEVLTKYSDYYTVDANGNFTADPNLTIAQISPAILNLYNAVNDALINMDAIAKQQ